MNSAPRSDVASETEMTSDPLSSLTWRAFSLPKRGNSDDELEDAFDQKESARRFAVAVADGATESICSDVWARLLVAKLASEPLPTDEHWKDWLTAPRESWWTDVRQRTLSMYAEHKLEEGASAAFVGIEFHPDGRWHAVSVGDSCLFHFRSGRRLLSFPLTSSSAFNNRPTLVNSNSAGDEISLMSAEGEWRPGDEFALMTDALSACLLLQFEQGAPAWDDMRRLLEFHEDRERLEAELTLLRNSRRLRNDDVTLLAVQT